MRVTGAHLKPYKSADDAGNEPPLKKSRMESPTGSVDQSGQMQFCFFGTPK